MVHCCKLQHQSKIMVKDAENFTQNINFAAADDRLFVESGDPSKVALSREVSAVSESPELHQMLSHVYRYVHDLTNR